MAKGVGFVEGREHIILLELSGVSSSSCEFLIGLQDFVNNLFPNGS